MKFHMSPKGYADRFVIQLMSADPFPLELGQGGLCNMNLNLDFDWINAKTVEDMTVCIWPDGSDADSRPDGYTITTGVIDEEDCLNPSPVPEVAPGVRYASICSTAGSHDCDPDMCNLLGTVPLQLTFHATYQ